MRIWVNRSNSIFFSNNFCFLFEFKLTSIIFKNRNNEKRFNQLMYFDRFFQHFVVDIFIYIELNNLNWVRINQSQLRVDLYSEIMNCLSEKVELIDINKKIIILLFNHVNDFKYMKIKEQNALTLIRKYDKFIYFIIFTCNSNWEKFYRDLLKRISIKIRSNLTTRVFQLKLKEN